MSLPAPPIDAWPAQPLAGHVVLISGGAQGVGRGIAAAALAAGGKVVIADLDGDAARQCLAEWPQHPAQLLALQMDVTDGDSVAAGIASTLQYFGQLDGLVNNAGVADPHLPPLDTADWNDWQRGLSSLHGAFWCSKRALPALRASGCGAIVNIASTRAHQSEPHSEAYAAAKGGLLAFNHALAVSEGPAVRVNAITPGWIETGPWQATAQRHAPQHRPLDHSQHPAGRVGVPQDIGALAVFLLSPLSGFITGQEFIADGGISRRMIYAD
jgi:NAD(P)-dependent dehydrogenase (short-subunit alcohol dehydrogenase family)